MQAFSPLQHKPISILVWDQRTKVLSVDISTTTAHHPQPQAQSTEHPPAPPNTRHSFHLPGEQAPAPLEEAGHSRPWLHRDTITR